jgi:hypothetical protein
MRYLDDGHVPIDDNWVENRIRAWAIGRPNWLLAGSLRAGQRAADIIGLLRSAQLNGHEPHVYLKDALTRLPTHGLETSQHCCLIAGSRRLPAPSSISQDGFAGRLPWVC